MLLVLVNLAATWLMVGLIWMVQVVHYPLLAYVGRAAFPAYERAHQGLITLIVGPVMLLELATAGLLLLARPPVMPVWVAWLGAALVGVVWISTALLQLPLHGVLGQGFDPRSHALLVSTNWVRTLAWTLRGLLMLWVVWLAVR